MVRTREQQRHRHHHHDHHGSEEPRIDPIEHGSSRADLKHDLDEILEEIDAVLEENEGLA